MFGRKKAAVNDTPAAIMTAFNRDMQRRLAEHDREIEKLDNYIQDAQARLDNHMIARRAIAAAMLETDMAGAMATHDTPPPVKLGTHAMDYANAC